MNLQDISDFLDLIKNPEKYQKLLDNLKDEQTRLSELVATVGKVTEIETLRKQAVKLVETSEKSLEKAKEKSIEITTKADTYFNSKQKELIEHEKKINDKLQQALDALDQNKKLQETFDLKKKDLERREKIVLERELSAIQYEKELTERLEKLRSVMG